MPNPRKANDSLKSKANKVPFGKYASVNGNGKSSSFQGPVTSDGKNNLIREVPSMTDGKGTGGEIEKCSEAHMSKLAYILASVSSLFSGTYGSGSL